MDSSRREASQHGSIWSYGILLAMVLLTFGRCLIFNFVEYDDHQHIYENPRLAALSWDNLRAIWSGTYFRLYVPVTETFWAILAPLARALGQPLNFQTGHYGLAPEIYHGANLLLHAGNASLVLSVLRCYGLRPWSALVGALLFALHPLQVEAVAWISGGRDLLMVFWSLIAIRLLFIAGERWLLPVGGALLSLTLALLSKPAAAGFPLILLGLALLLAVRGGHGYALAGSARLLQMRLITASAAALLVVIPVILVARAVQPESLLYAPTPWYFRPVVVGYALLFYARQALLPMGLTPFYGLSPEYLRQDAGALVLGIVGLVLPLAGMWLFRSARVLLAALMLIYGGALLPVLGLLDFGHQNLSTVVDRYAYLALLGPSLGLALSLDWIEAHSSRRAAKLAAAGSIVVVFGWAAYSVVQAELWRDTPSLYQGALHRDGRPFPSSHGLYYGYGAALYKRGDDKSAELAFREAIRRQPRMVEAHFDLGLVLARQGRKAEALAAYEEAIRLDPSMPQALINTAVAYIEGGRVALGLELLDRAIKVSPQSSLAHFNSGIALSKLERWSEAAAAFAEAARLEPTMPIVYQNLAVAYERLGNHDQARQARARALELSGVPP